MLIGVLSTGFGKSMLFHLLPHFIPVKTTKNTVIVVCPLNSIIEDQLKVLKPRRITANVLQLAVNEKEPAENFLEMNKNQASTSSRIQRGFLKMLLMATLRLYSPIQRLY